MPMTRTHTFISILSALGVIIAAPQMAAAQTSNPLAGLYACEAVTNADAQLACFRAETAKLRGGEATVSVPDVSVPDVRAPDVRAPAISAAPVIPAEPLAAEKESAPVFNEAFETKTKTAKAPKQRSSAIRNAATYGANGYIRFTLENGEVWQQIERANLRLGKGSPDVLTIKKASLGSFRGRINDKRPSFRIKRIK